MDELQILNLADAPEHTEQVSRWLWEEWARADGYTLEEIVFRTRHSMLRDTVPQQLVALWNGQAAGTVALWRNDCKTRQDLSPWMAVLYVDPAFRNRHIGQALQRASIEAARALGRYDWLYLITELENYYEKTGWEFVGDAPVGHGHTEKIYRCSLKG